MLIQQQMAAYGQQYWQEYVNVYGADEEPDVINLMALARKLNVQFTYLRSCIAIFLSA